MGIPALLATSLDFHLLSRFSIEQGEAAETRTACVFMLSLKESTYYKRCKYGSTIPSKYSDVELRALPLRIHLINSETEQLQNSYQARLIFTVYMPIMHGRPATSMFVILES